MKLPNIPSLIGQGLGHVIHVPVDLFCGIKKGFIDAGKDKEEEEVVLKVKAKRTTTKPAAVKSTVKRTTRATTKKVADSDTVAKINKEANELPPHNPETGEIIK